jgi:hypothetical protein
MEWIKDDVYINSVLRSAAVKLVQVDHEYDADGLEYVVFHVPTLVCFTQSTWEKTYNESEDHRIAFEINAYNRVVSERPEPAEKTLFCPACGNKVVNIKEGGAIYAVWHCHSCNQLFQLKGHHDPDEEGYDDFVSVLDDLILED